MANGTEYDKGKQDGAILQELRDINEHLVDIKDAVKGHEIRIRTLENWKWWVIGASGLVGIGAAKVTQAMTVIWYA